MTVADASLAKQTPWTVPLFAGTVFASAALTFMVEPLIGKMILPALGGAPAVWNACMAFFQTALLAGYLYAHLLQRFANVAAQVFVHLFLLAAAAFVLPVGVTQALGAASVAHPITWTLGVLTISIGAPFAMLSATAPLLQAWYARANAGSQNPYVLYSASNLGSMLALLAYPTVVEPFFAVHAQSSAWTALYSAFCALIGATGIIASRGSVRWSVQVENTMSARTSAPTWRQCILWLSLAAVPSSLMLGATTYLSDDVVSAPFLWVIPLALYLLTFVIAFQTKPAIPRERALLWQSIFVPVAVGLFCITTASLFAHFVGYIGAFFFSALVCHQRLAATRPDPRHLTQFYLIVSLGGVLGGMFNAFLAPLIFTRVAEFPLVLALAVLARPWDAKALSLQFAAIAVFGVAVACAIAFVPAQPAYLYVPVSLAIAGGVAAVCVSKRTVLFALVIGAFALVSVLVPPDNSVDLFATRSFFGTYRVTTIRDAKLGPMTVMFHGTTIHGAQPQAVNDRCLATTYYAKPTPIGQTFTAMIASRPRLNIGVVGLGIGTLATYPRTGDHLRFFEIDPEVERIARDRRFFTFLSDCAKTRPDVVLGDARLMLAMEQPQTFDLLVLDAFSADAVPTHLLTVEALELYLRLIKPDGVLLLHLSNRNLALEAPAAAGARAAGAIALMQNYAPRNAASDLAESGTQAMVIAKSGEALEPFLRDPRWRPARDRGARAWSDDYTNVFGALLDRARGR